MPNFFYKKIFILVSLLLGLLIPINVVVAENDIKSNEYKRYEKTLKEIEQQNKFLDESQKIWKNTFQERLVKYNNILEKLDKIDSSLYTKLDCGALRQDYKYVVELWRSFVENSFANISGSVIERQLPELVVYDSFSKESDISQEKIMRLERAYKNLQLHYNKYNKNFDIAFEKDILYYNKILLYSGKLRSKIYQRLAKAKDATVYEFSNEDFADLWREIRIIPLRWTATFYSKILEFRGHLYAGPVGYMMVLKELIIFGLLILFSIAFGWFFNRMTNKFESISELYYRKSYNNNIHWFPQYLLSLLNRTIPLLILQLGLFFISGMLETTTISELGELIPYIEYYIIYRIGLIITSYTITKFKANNLITISYTKHAKSIRSLTAIYRFILVNMMLLHTIEAIVGEAMIYGICFNIYIFAGILYSTYLIDKWRIEIFKYSAKNFSDKTFSLVRNHFHKFYAPFVSLTIFFAIIIMKLYSLILMQLEQFDFSKKISAKIFLAQIKKITPAQMDQTLHPLPELYVSQFVGKDSISSFLVEPNEFIHSRNVIEKWLDGKSSSNSMLLYGAYGSGKTTLIDSLNQYFDKTIYKNITISEKLLNPDAFILSLKEVLGGKSSKIEDLISEWQTRKDKIIISIDDAHNLFLSALNGFEAMKVLIDIINSNIKNVFWVISFHSFAWDHVSKVLECTQCFDTEIELESWSSDDIEDLIMSRHREAYYELSFEDIFFALEKNHVKDTIDYMKSKFFQLLWEQSDGNPARAISLWLSALRYDGKYTLHVSLPAELDSTNILNLGSNLLFVCSAILRHEFLSIEEIVSVTDQDKDTILYIIKLCKKKGILVQDDLLNYRLNPEYSSDIIRILKRKNYVY